MKVVILAGGLAQNKRRKPFKAKTHDRKEISLILWHIMKIYSCHGYDDFIICLGYKGYLIKEFFANYYLHTSDVTFDFKKE